MVEVQDVDVGDMVTVSVPIKPDWLTFDVPSTTLSGVPTNDEVGVFAVTIRAEDGNGGLVEQPFNLTVINVNDSPRFESTPIIVAEEDSEYTYAVSASDPDDGDRLRFSLVSLPGWLVLVDNGNGTALLSGTPENQDVGEIEVTILLEDNAGVEIEQSFTILVNNTNDPPEIISDPITKVALGDSYSYQIEATDVDLGDELTLTATTLPSFLTFVDNGDGTGLLSGVVTNEISLEKEVAIRVSDLAGAFDEQQYEFILNNPPLLTDVSLAIGEDSTLVIELVDFESGYTDTDDDDIENIQILSLPSRGLLFWQGSPVSQDDILTVENSELNNFSYQPGLDFNGTDFFEWNAFDGTAYADNSARLNITINSVNDAPVLTIAGNEPVEYSLGDPATAVIDTTLTINDVDNTTMFSARVEIVDNYAQGDLLSYDDINNMTIIPSFDDVNGVLTLEGEDTRSNYETALRQVLFSSPVTGEADLSDKRIRITINDGEAESQPAERILQITEIFPEIDLVNSFTPNGDGVNDTWDFTNLQFYTDIKIIIYNQGGDVVFECDTQDCEWDGTHNNQELPAGTYFYTIDLNDGKRENMGTVTILK
ncbi:MAG: putative Ig domain-containing protein [Bacteroidota bacterium]